MSARMLDAFAGLFRGKAYQHRASNLGDHVASFLFEDLAALGRSPKFAARLAQNRIALNTANRAIGREARRGDGTFGETVPDVAVAFVDGFSIPRAPIASVEIGVETKILAKAMIKQIDRVINDLTTQVSHFRSSNPKVISVGIVGVNHAEIYTSFEGDRSFTTNGGKMKHPVQEATEAIRRINERAKPKFDELLILRFRATNAEPFPFEWMDEKATRMEYAAALSRIAREYESRVV